MGPAENQCKGKNITAMCLTCIHAVITYQAILAIPNTCTRWPQSFSWRNSKQFLLHVFLSVRIFALVWTANTVSVSNIQFSATHFCQVWRDKILVYFAEKAPWRICDYLCSYSIWLDFILFKKLSKEKYIFCEDYPLSYFL